MTATIPKYIFRADNQEWEPGPEKEIPPMAWNLGRIPDDLMQAIRNDVTAYPLDRNDIGNKESYPISGYTNLDGYRQVLLQNHQGNGNNEMDYVQDDPSATCLELIRQHYPLMRFCRARLMMLNPGHSVPWHVDANTREYVRIHFMVGGRCQWLFRKHRQRYTMTMLPSNIWFTNTAWLHTITNDGNEERVMLTIHAEYGSMIRQFGEAREDAVTL